MSNGHLHVHRQVIEKTPEEVTRDVLNETHAIGPRYKLALLFFGGLLVLGVIGFIMRAASDGFDTFTPWGYLMAAFAFLLTTAMSAPVFSITQRMVRSHWRRSLSRVSELFAVVGVLATLMFIPLILMMPAAAGRRTIWFGWSSTPHVTDLLAVSFLALLGLAILYVGALPDLAASRQHATGRRKALLDRLVIVRWQGTERQWAVHRATLVAMGAMYFLFLVFVQLLIASDFAEAMVPGWKDAIFPAWQSINALQSAVACTVLALFLLHKLGGVKDYIHVDQFWGASKILLPLSLLWMYFWFSGFIVFWYGRQPVEDMILRTFMFESYRVPFLLAFILCFLMPFLILMWNFVRKSMLGPTIVAVLILFGTLFDKIRIYVASFSIADARPDALATVHSEPLSEVVKPVLPGVADVFMVLGAIGGAIFLYLLAMKVVPVLSLWEIKEGILYRRARRFLKMNIMVMGKPE